MSFAAVPEAADLAGSRRDRFQAFHFADLGFDKFTGDAVLVEARGKAACDCIANLLPCVSVSTDDVDREAIRRFLNHLIRRDFGFRTDDVIDVFFDQADDLTVGTGQRQDMFFPTGDRSNNNSCADRLRTPREWRFDHSG